MIIQKIKIKVIFALLLSCAFFIISLLPKNFISYIWKNKNPDLTLAPASDMFLGQNLIKKVYAGTHNDICFSDDNNITPNYNPNCQSEVIAGCSLFPIGWGNSDTYQTNPWDTYQVIASFSNSTDADEWYWTHYSDYMCWGGSMYPETYLDIQFFDSSGEIDYQDYCYILDPGGTYFPPCNPSDGEAKYIYISGGLSSSLSSNIIQDDGTIQFLGDNPATLPDEGVWLMVGTLAGDNYPPVSCNNGPSASITHVINNPPTTDAGTDQTVSELSNVDLAGTGNDPDSPCQTPIFLWEQIDSSGYTITLDNNSILTPSFTAPDITESSVNLTFRLTTSDGQFSESDEVNIIIIQQEGPSPTPTLNISITPTPTLTPTIFILPETKINTGSVSAISGIIMIGLGLFIYTSQTNYFLGNIFWENGGKYILAGLSNKYKQKILQEKLNNFKNKIKKVVD